jgi:hypothetical protein
LKLHKNSGIAVLHDRKLAHAHLEIAAFAKNVSMLDSLAEDLVKAFRDSNGKADGEVGRCSELQL